MFPPTEESIYFRKKELQQKVGNLSKDILLFALDGAGELYARTFYISCAFCKLIPTPCIFYSEKEILSI